MIPHDPPTSGAPATLSEAERRAIAEAIAHSALLSALDPAEAGRLLAQACTVALDADQYLFRQGDPSDAAFVVVSGLLSAMVEGDNDQSQVVGNVRAGECVGEMGVLTSSPRSLSVVARTPATLLRIALDDLTGLCHERPALLLKFLRVISDRSRETISALSSLRRVHAITIVPVHGDGLPDTFLRTLAAGLRANDQFDVITAADGVTAGGAAPAGPARTRVLVADCNLTGWSQQCLETSDRVVLVADAQRHQSKFGETALRILESAGPYAYLDKEIVLLHESNPASVGRWLAFAPFRRHHHVHVKRQSDYTRFVRYLRGQAVAVVLSGGGIRGWVHLGALRALAERNIPIDCIGGSSVGSVVAACHLIHENVSDTIESFTRVIGAMAKSRGVTNLTYPVVSILNGRRWTAALKEELGVRTIEELPLPYFAVSCNISRNEQVVHQRGSLWEAVRASSSLPAILPPFVKDGELHIDGGIVNNVPVDVAKHIMGPATKTIAIELSGSGDLDPRRYNFPPVLSFTDTVLARMRLRNKDYRFISIGEVILRALAHGSMMRTNENLRAADIAVRPTFTNQGFLTTHDAAGLLDLGYQSMIAQLDEKGVFA
jgi:NTE family protein